MVASRGACRPVPDSFGGLDLDVRALGRGGSSGRGGGGSGLELPDQRRGVSTPDYTRRQGQRGPTGVAVNAKTLDFQGFLMPFFIKSQLLCQIELKGQVVIQ